jgi:hypothetical protein
MWKMKRATKGRGESKQQESRGHSESNWLRVNRIVTDNKIVDLGGVKRNKSTV